MKCIDCSACRKGFFKSKPAAFVCTGVQEPFVIEDPNVECTEYEFKRKKVTPDINHTEYFKPYLDSNGIHLSPKLFIPKDLFIEAYKKWIGTYSTVGEDNADDWSE